MKRIILFSIAVVGLALTFGACRKNNSATPSTSSNTKNPADLIHAMAKTKVKVEEKKGVYITLGDMPIYGCMSHPTAKCYWITVSSSSSGMIVMDGDIEGNYTATSEYPEDKIQMHINTPQGERVVETTEITQTIDENGTATVTYK